jgi:hypothetical protein
MNDLRSDFIKKHAIRALVNVTRNQGGATSSDLQRARDLFFEWIEEKNEKST